MKHAGRTLHQARRLSFVRDLGLGGLPSGSYAGVLGAVGALVALLSALFVGQERLQYAAFVRGPDSSLNYVFLAASALFQVACSSGVVPLVSILAEAFACSFPARHHSVTLPRSTSLSVV